MIIRLHRKNYDSRMDAKATYHIEVRRGVRSRSRSGLGVVRLIPLARSAVMLEDAGSIDLSATTGRLMDAIDIIVLDTGGQTSDIDAPNSAGISFGALPIRAILPNSELPRNVRILSRRKNYPARYIRVLQGIDYAIGQNATVLNLSLGETNTLPNTDADPDPLHAAIGFASRRGVAVVVAAGNQGPKDDTLQFLARSPSVISVGATDSSRSLLASSSRGIPGRSGPFVVCSGEPDRDLQKRQYLSVPGLSVPVTFDGFPPIDGATSEEKKIASGDFREYSAGTSFAAPRVSRVVGFLRVLINVIMSDVVALQKNSWTDAVLLEMPIIAICDTGTMPEMAATMLSAPPAALPHTHEQAGWYRALTGKLDREFGVKSRIGSDVAGLKLALAAIASPLPANAPHEVGCGYVDDRELAAAVRAFTPSLWVKIFANDAKIPPARLSELDAELGPLWNEAQAELIVDHFAGTPKIIMIQIV